jgi:hypothetical protein
MIKQLLTQGYYKTKDEDAFQFLDIYNVEWTGEGTIPLQMVVRSPATQQALETTQQWLGEKYIRPVFGDYHCDYCDLVKGMDENVYEWHNDYELNKVNLGILLYFTDTDESTGTDVQFRTANTQSSTGAFYPKTGDVAFLNHTVDFEHIVTEQKIKLPRIVASFHYHVDYENIK